MMADYINQTEVSGVSLGGKCLSRVRKNPLAAPPGRRTACSTTRHQRVATQAGTGFQSVRAFFRILLERPDSARNRALAVAIAGVMGALLKRRNSISRESFANIWKPCGRSAMLPPTRQAEYVFHADPLPNGRGSVGAGLCARGRDAV